MNSANTQFMIHSIRMLPLHFRLCCVFTLLAVAAPAAESLDRAAAEKKVQELWRERIAQLQTERAAEMENKSLVLADKKLRWAERVFGEAPARGHSLWISMHGGGGAPTAVNDRQWTNQISLYKLDEGIYVAPRAPTDNWNLWHESHID